MKIKVALLISSFLHLLVAVGFSLNHQELANLSEVMRFDAVEFSPAQSTYSQPGGRTPGRMKRPQPPADSQQSPADLPSSGESSQSLSAVPVQPVELGQVTILPRILFKKKVPYPRSAQRAGIEGVVELKIVIDPFGSVLEVQVLRGPGYGLEEAAVAAMKDCRFSPAQIGDQKVAVQMIYKYEFVIGE